MGIYSCVSCHVTFDPADANNSTVLCPTCQDYGPVGRQRRRELLKKWYPEALPSSLKKDQEGSNGGE